MTNINIDTNTLRSALEGNKEALKEVQSLLPPSKPTTGLMGKWAKHPTLKDVLIASDRPGPDGMVIVTYPDETYPDGMMSTDVLFDDLMILDQNTKPEEEAHFDNLPKGVKQALEDSIKDYKAARFVDFSLDEEEPSSPQPEDVPVNEPWLVETPFMNGVGYRHASQSNPWFVTYPGHSERTWNVWKDSDVTLIARLVPETAKQDDEQDFDPAYAYTDRAGDIWRYMSGGWRWKGLIVSLPHGTPPAEGGPYTRIEKNTNHDH